MTLAPRRDYTRAAFGITLAKASGLHSRAKYAQTLMRRAFTPAFGFGKSFNVNPSLKSYTARMRAR